MSYTIKKITGAPDWNTVPALHMDVQLWSEPIDIKSQAQVCWDEENLYVRMKTKEKDIRAECTGRLDHVCDDSCLEFFFRPTEDLRYFNVEINPNCCMYLGYGSGIRNLVRLVVRDPAVTFAPKAERTEDGWEVRYKFPFAFIKQFFPEFEAKEGAVMYANFYKCGDKTPHPHYFLWKFVTDKPESSFHSPAEFGKLIFGGTEV